MLVVFNDKLIVIKIIQCKKIIQTYRKNYVFKRAKLINKVIKVVSVLEINNNFMKMFVRSKPINFQTE